MIFLVYVFPCKPLLMTIVSYVFHSTGQVSYFFILHTSLLSHLSSYVMSIIITLSTYHVHLYLFLLCDMCPYRTIFPLIHSFFIILSCDVCPCHTIIRSCHPHVSFFYVTCILVMLLCYLVQHCSFVWFASSSHNHVIYHPICLIFFCDMYTHHTISLSYPSFVWCASSSHCHPSPLPFLFIFIFFLYECHMPTCYRYAR